MKFLFLSASIPDSRRNASYWTTADVVSIRDAIRALATVALPHCSLHWGGHPAITPLIRVVAQSMGLTGRDRVRLFQSAWFSDQFPIDNAAFEGIELTPRGATVAESLWIMRDQMLRSAHFDAGIFIGGMEGVEEEFDMFRELHPRSQVLPVASTGAAARLIYERERLVLDLPIDLADDYAYPSLFRKLLDLPLNSRGR